MCEKLREAIQKKKVIFSDFVRNTDQPSLPMPIWDLINWEDFEHSRPLPSHQKLGLLSLKNTQITQIKIKSIINCKYIYQTIMFSSQLISFAPFCAPADSYALSVPTEFMSGSASFYLNLSTIWIQEKGIQPPLPLKLDPKLSLYKIWVWSYSLPPFFGQSPKI